MPDDLRALERMGLSGNMVVLSKDQEPAKPKPGNHDGMREALLTCLAAMSPLDVDEQERVLLALAEFFGIPRG